MMGLWMGNYTDSTKPQIFFLTGKCEAEMWYYAIEDTSFMNDINYILDLITYLNSASDIFSSYIVFPSWHVSIVM